MKCEQVVEGVQDLLLDLLEPQDRREIETHLRGCAECAQALEKARKALAVLHEWNPQAPKRKPMTTRRSVTTPVPSLWKPALAAAAALVGLTILVLTARERPTPPDPEILVKTLPPSPAPVPEPERAQEPVPALPPPVAPPNPIVPPEKKIRPEPPLPAPVKAAPPPEERKKEKSPEEPANSAPREPGKTTATSVARVERVKGDVFVSGERCASEGLELRPGERLFTRGAGSIASVRCPDLSRLEIGGATVIRYDGANGVLLELGKLEVDAKDLAFATFNASVEAGEARFTLEKKDDVTLLQVRQGTVRFTNLVTGKLLQAKPGQNVKAEGHPKVDQRKVDAAVANGIAFLRQRPLAGLRGGTDELELVLYTLLHGGVSDRDPDVQALLKTLLALEPQKTYNTALRAMVLEKVDRVRYQEEIWKCAQYLLDNQAATGQWGYGTPTTYGPMPKRVPTGTATGGRPKAVDFSDKSVRSRVAVTKKRDGAASDNSNSQYAALGLRACHDAGIDLPKDAITLARKWLLDCQAKEEAGAGNGVATGGIAAPPRGWGYTTGPVYGSMTAGAIGSVCIYDYILDGEKALSWKRDPAVLSGIAWLAQNFSPTGNPGVDKAVGGQYSLIPDGAMFYYYLYAVERTGLLFGTEKFGAREWYPEGAAVLLKTQQADGSWPAADTHKNAVWDTCFSILFLRRATRPLMDVASEDGKSKK